ncbi:MAG: hypothetical protein ACLQDM_20550 [Bradyrhizobium sp.]
MNGFLDGFVGGFLRGFLGGFEEAGMKNRFPLPRKTLYGAARLCHRQSYIIDGNQRLVWKSGLWRAV